MNGSIEQLLVLEDEQFVVAAYKMLLHRPPDPGGRQHYLQRVRAGIDKAHIIYEIAIGEEARRVGTNLAGLDALIRRQRSGRIPVVRAYLLWRGLIEPNGWYARRLRALASQMARAATNQSGSPETDPAIGEPHVPGGVDPLAAWGIQLSTRYEANNPDLSWVGFSAPEARGNRFLRWVVDERAAVGFWWPYAAASAELQLELRTEELLPLRITLASEVIFDHGIHIANGSIGMRCSRLLKGHNEIRLVNGAKPESGRRSTLAVFAIRFSKE